MDSKVIIIGAGLAGLSAGCYAQMNGFRSQIFEHHSVPGGVAAGWKRQEYLIDGGIHFMMGHKPGTDLYQVLKDLGASDPSLYVDMVSYGRFIHQASGIDLKIDSNLDKLASKLKELAPEDSLAIEEITHGAKAFQGRNLSSFGMSQPPELTSRFSQFKELWQMRSAIKYFSGRHSRKIADFAVDLRTPWLKDFFCSLFLPESPVWFIMMILALLADKQCGFLVRGCLTFVLAIERHYRELGGEVTYKSTVDKILVENNRAVGIRVADGREYRADYVVSTGDSYNTIFNLLQGRYISDRIKKRHETWALSRPFLTVSCGVAREFTGDNPFTTIVLDDPVTIGNEKVKTLFVRILNYGTHFAPVGKTLLQVEIETNFDYWFNLQSEDRALYDREKERIAREFLSSVERYYPGISSQVEVVDIATPYTTWRYTLNCKGAWGAWLMTSDIMKERIERKLPGLKNFYLAGQWVMCGGVPPSLFSGRHAIQLMCHDEKGDLSPRVKRMVNSTLNQELIAPCGMNCGICVSYLAMRNDLKKKGVGKKYCAGCLPRGKNCAFMKKQCDLLGKGLVRFCYECGDFSCRRLKALDKRYRTKYHMSMIENFDFIKEHGIRKFLEKEATKWQCPECGGVICCHNGLCFNCGLVSYAKRSNTDGGNNEENVARET